MGQQTVLSTQKTRAATRQQDRKKEPAGPKVDSWGNTNTAETKKNRNTSG